MRKRQLPGALLKLRAKYMTFRRKCAVHCNSLFSDVSFPLHLPSLGASGTLLFCAARQRARFGYFFSTETTALIHRRYMP
jgi:hypothetical protein